MKILISGGSGQLGTLFRELVPKTMCAPHTAGLAYEIEALEPEVFINFAAQSSPAYSVQHPELTWQTNYYDLVPLLEAVPSFPNTRFIFVTTCEIYSANKTPYSESKLALFNHLRVLNAPNVICTVQYPTESHLRSERFFSRKVTSYVNRLVKSNFSIPPLPLGAVQGVYRDWTDARDVAEAYLILARAPHVSFPEVEICSGVNRSLMEFISGAFRLAGVSNFTDWISYDESLDRKVSNLPPGNPEPMKSLGWSPRYSFLDMIQNMLDNEHSS